MDAFVIHGGRRLTGHVRIHGAKNAALPLMAAALLTDEPVVLRDVPDLADIRNMVRLLAKLGVDARREATGGTFESTSAGASGTAADATLNGRPGPLRLHATDPDCSEAPYDIVRTMRASISVLGPLLTKRGYARVSMPGGCNIGDRPVDLHLRGLRALGAQITLDEGYIVAQAPGYSAGGKPGRLIGKRIFLGGPFGSTVTGTENIMCAAALAAGTTVIESAACEPEVEDVARLLNAMGARIEGAGSPRITIHGVESLHGAEHAVLPDRIEAGTYMMAAAITNGDVTLENCPIDAMSAVLDRLSAIGVHAEPVEGLEGVASIAGGGGDGLRQTVRIASNRRLEPVPVTTQPHPGFPTDLQAQIMALLCMADGNSIITEKIYPDRFLHVAELLRMGANLVRNGPSVLVSGVRQMTGAPVMASDLRASAGLVLAGLAAQGTTTINRVYHLDRGYERMEKTLQGLGADIERVDGEAV